MEFQWDKGQLISVNVSQVKEMQLTVLDLKLRVAQLTDVEETAFYLTYNGKIIHNEDIPHIEGNITIVPRILGGKGGFGSMLRAIGAQIEKTTNRDACRDLSGRRLRDINEEQRLKRWFAKQKEREAEKVEAKKRRLEKLKQLTEGPPLPVIDDQQYNKQRAEMADSVFEAVDKGFEVHVPGKSSNSNASATVTSVSDESSSESSAASEPLANPSSSPVAESGTSSSAGTESLADANPSAGCSSTLKKADPPKKKPLKRLMLDEDFDSCTSSDESEDEKTSAKKVKLAG